MGINIILLAGSKGSQSFKQDGKHVPKTRYKILDKSLADWTLEGILDCDENIERVIVVGDALTRNYDWRVTVVPEQNDPVRALLHAFGTKILPANGFPPIPTEKFFDSDFMDNYMRNYPSAANIGTIFVTGDSPFITGRDMDLFLNGLKKETDLAGIFSTQKSLLDALRSTTADKRRKKQIKKKLKNFPISIGKVRFGGIFYAKPLRFGNNEYKLIQKLYSLRHQTDEKGEWDESKFKGVRKAFKEYRKSAVRGKKFLRYAARVKIASKMGRRKTRITPMDSEKAIRDFITYGNYQLIFMNGAASMIDIDHKKVIKAMEAKDCEIFRQLKEYFSSENYNPSLVYPAEKQTEIKFSQQNQKASSCAPQSSE
jgi:hypothetical protein